ncbi:UDP-glucose 4-epimerase GalE [Pseudomonas helleri]|uniref:UDP-glucose 4-epimerase GalE n=1 Tax=Pseudomonas helleri TaxID=1608996 RepID=UPI003FD38006
MNILVTGGAGYIGSHTVVELLNEGHEVVVVDNFVNSTEKVFTQIERICGRSPVVLNVDVCCYTSLKNVFLNYSFDCVMHFAGLKSVAESSREPIRYYKENVVGSINLLNIMKEMDVGSLVFSSSATVYGDTTVLPISESAYLVPPNSPYGETKLVVENLLRSLATGSSKWKVAILRYFNPVGAHTSGLMGELPTGVPNNLMPYIGQVASGKLPRLSIFGNDYNTIDGTGVRDYIHIVDLARGHLAALNYLKSNNGCHVWNLGTGKGYSVFQIVSAFEKASGVHIPYQILPRRTGDVAECWSDPKKALEDLGWKAEFDLHNMVSDAWKWQENMPDDYS